MKKLFISLTIILAFSFCHAQELKPHALNGEYYEGQSYTKVYYDSIVPALQKFNNAKEWVATSFGDYQSVLQYEDRETFKIIIKARKPIEKVYDTANIRISYEPNLNFTLTIDCRDDKFRMKFENMDLDAIRTFIGPITTTSEVSFTITEFAATHDLWRYSLSKGMVSILNSAYNAITKQDDF
ncbi:MAG: DUF4468 domain-containing protein [Bacteroidales bacterium]|nr:DUF4468 domain-containing protein [Bacteroidales bacterium]